MQKRAQDYWKEHTDKMISGEKATMDMSPAGGGGILGSLGNTKLPCGCWVEGPYVVVWACREHWWVEGGGWLGGTLLWLLVAGTLASVLIAGLFYTGG